MRKWTEQTVMHSYPGLVSLVTAEWNDKQNIMAAGWHTYISYDPPIYGVAIAKERYTDHLIENKGEFAVNFLPAEKAEWIQNAGTTTGKAENKFSNIPYTNGKTITAPILTDAYITYECKVIDQNTYGDHDFFVGEITGFYKENLLFTVIIFLILKSLISLYT